MLNDSTSVIHVPEQIVHTHFILRFLSLFDYKQQQFKSTWLSNVTIHCNNSWLNIYSLYHPQQQLYTRNLLTLSSTLTVAGKLFFILTFPSTVAAINFLFTELVYCSSYHPLSSYCYSLTLSYIIAAIGYLLNVSSTVAAIGYLTYHPLQQLLAIYSLYHPLQQKLAIH